MANTPQPHETYGQEVSSFNLPMVDWVEPFNTHIYPLYVQIATEMHRVDGVDAFWGGGQPAICTIWQIPHSLTKHMAKRFEALIYPW